MAMGNMAMEDKVMEAMEMKRKQRSRRIDLHMHILPGVDDGAETMEDAVDVLEMYYGRDAAEVLMERNPGRIVESAPGA